MGIGPIMQGVPSSAGGAPHRPWLALAILVLGLVIAAATCAGCGSAIRQHASAATVLSVATSGAARVVDAAATADAETTCPDAADACMATLRERWAPVDVAIAATRTALLAYVEAISIASQAEAGGDVVAALAIALARVLAAADEIGATLREHGVDVPALPPWIGLLVGAGS